MSTMGQKASKIVETIEKTQNKALRILNSIVDEN